MLFEQMEKLRDDTIKGDELKEELERSKAVDNIAGKILDLANLSLNAAKFDAQYGIKSPDFFIENKGSYMKNKGMFKKGYTPWNKGVTGYMGANKTSFKKGNVPANAKPVGSISLRNNYKKGEKYYYIKVKEPNKWEQLHSYIWEKAHGKVPKGSVVIFKDDNTLNTDLSNLHLIKRSELLILNRHFAKADISAVKLKAMINKRVKNATTD